MVTVTPSSIGQSLKTALQPWYDALENPAEAQEKVLQELLVRYAHNDYGKQHGADRVSSIADYRNLFPVITYEKDIRPMIYRVMAGEHELLLDEAPVTWARTRSTTGFEPKFIPYTSVEIQTRTRNVPRANMHYVLTNNRYDIFEGVSMNLHYPSVIGKLKIKDKEIEYGYCTGIDARYHPADNKTFRYLPDITDIDMLGGEDTDKDWEARFELAYQKCKDKNVTQIGGVAPPIVFFGEWLKKVYGIYPKDIWQVKLLTLGSVPGISTYYQSLIAKLFGEQAVIRENYGATEGFFGFQRDECRAWVPIYDCYFFEVQIGDKIKMLHEMNPGEIGSLIVSTPTFPRYKVGDLIKAYRSPYIRCIGRENRWAVIKYYWNEMICRNLDRL